MPGIHGWRMEAWVVASERRRLDGERTAPQTPNTAGKCFRARGARKSACQRAPATQTNPQFRGYSLVVKFQSSKLAMRVRFPLPALFLYQTRFAGDSGSANWRVRTVSENNSTIFRRCSPASVCAGFRAEVRASGQAKREANPHESGKNGFKCRFAGGSRRTFDCRGAAPLRQTDQSRNRRHSREAVRRLLQCVVCFSPSAYC